MHLPFHINFEKREKLTHLPNHWPYKHFIQAFRAPAPCTTLSADFRTVVDSVCSSTPFLPYLCSPSAPWSCAMQLSYHLWYWLLDDANGFALLVMLRAFPRYKADSGPCCAPFRPGRARFWPWWSAHDCQYGDIASRANSCTLHPWLRVQNRDGEDSFFMGVHGRWGLLMRWTAADARGACLGALLHVFWPACTCLSWMSDRVETTEQSFS